MTVVKGNEYVVRIHEESITVWKDNRVVFRVALGENPKWNAVYFMFYELVESLEAAEEPYIVDEEIYGFISGLFEKDFDDE